MKNLRYSLLMLFVLAPAMAMAQTTSDSLNIIVTDGDTFLGLGAAFGTPFVEGEQIGPLPIVAAEPFIGCAEDPDNPDADPLGFIPAIDNADEVAGNIVLISRGSCQFSTKTKAASQAGAVAVIIANDDRMDRPDEDPILMGGDCTPEDCSIPAAGASRNARITLAQEAEFGSTVTLDPFSIQATPPPSTAGTHDTGVMTLSVYDYGFIGANANFAAEGDGQAFAFDGVEGGLFVSSVLVGQADVVNTNPYTQAPPEFVNDQPVATITAPAPFNQAFETEYSSEELGVQVTQRSYSRDGDPYVVVELDVLNTSGGALDDVYVGIFADWDVGTTSGDDEGDVDESRNLVYVYDPVEDAPYYGVTALGDEALSGYNPTATTADDPQLFGSLTMAIDTATVAQEHATVVGTGPYNIASGETVTVRFAYVGGADEAALLANVDEVRGLSVATEASTPEGTYVLGSAYPNPVSARATIGFELPVAQDVTLKVYDVLGREVATLIEGVRQAGPQSVEFDVSSLPSGVYVYRLEAGSTQITERMTIVR